MAVRLQVTPNFYAETQKSVFLFSASIYLEAWEQKLSFSDNLINKLEIRKFLFRQTGMEFASKICNMSDLAHQIWKQHTYKSVKLELKNFPENSDV